MMKKLALFLTCAIVVCGMASCLDDNNTQNVLTQEKMSAAVKTMEGTYHGKMVYTSDPGKIPDTIKNITWTVDSVITIKDFPRSIFSQSLTPQANPQLLDALKNLPNEDLKCNIGFYSVEDDLYTLNVMPHSIDFKWKVDNTEHDSHIVFFNGNETSVGIFKISTKEMIFMMNTYALYIDKVTQTSDLFRRTVFKLIATSKG